MLAGTLPPHKIPSLPGTLCSSPLGKGGPQASSHSVLVRFSCGPTLRFHLCTGVPIPQVRLCWGARARGAPDLPCPSTDPFFLLALILQLGIVRDDALQPIQGCGLVLPQTPGQHWVRQCRICTYNHEGEGQIN